MAYKCSAIIGKSSNETLKNLLSSIHIGVESVIVDSSQGNPREFYCHFLAGRPSDSSMPDSWRSTSVTVDCGISSDLHDPLAMVVNQASRHFNETQCGYYPSARVPLDILVDLYAFCELNHKQLWIYYSESSGGPFLDCEFSWMLDGPNTSLVVWDESKKVYISFSSTESSSELIDKSALTLGCSFVGLKDVSALKRVLF